MKQSKPKPQRTQYVRNPVYVFYVAAALGLLGVTTVLAARSAIGLLEQAVFNVLYRLPDFLTPMFLFFTFFGSIASAMMIAFVFLVLRRRDIALRVFAASTIAYFVARFAKGWVERGRPSAFFDFVVPRDQATGFGFPSGHAAVSVAVGLTLALYAPRAWRKWIILFVFMVGCSRVYLGVHLPLDIIGGFAIGLLSYSLVSLAFGSKYTPIDAKGLAKKLAKAGMIGLKLKPAAVDARGSVPFFGEYEGGKVFVKVFNQDNNAADWLFKLMRRVRFRRLEDEIPSLTPKRAIEHEAFVTMLAQQTAGVRVPQMVGVYNVGPNSYAMASMRLDADGLDHMSAADITDAMLDGIWKQIKQLHRSNIIHKDLRAANVMVEKSTKKPWLIDFGFAENAADRSSYYKDNVEFIASTATKVGAKRAVAAAERALGKQELGEALPYMQYAALSGATTSGLKANKGLLDEVRAEAKLLAGINGDAPQNIQMTRISMAKLAQICIILLLCAILAPQIDDFKEGLEILKTTDLLIFAQALIFSVLTYVWAALSFKSLSNVPLAFRRLFIVQWASSFANKLLPAGLGAISFNTMFMNKSGHNEGESATIALLNNMLGVVSSTVLLLMAVMLWRSDQSLFSQITISSTTVVVIGVIVIAAILLIKFIYHRLGGFRKKIDAWFSQSRDALKAYAHKPLSIVGSLGAQLLLTLTYTSVMVLGGKALGIQVNFSQALFAVMAGALVASITPTPGGIGGAEAGIVAGLTFVGIDTSSAIAVAILYRLATFWLTIPPSYLAYRYSFTKHYYL